MPLKILTWNAFLLTIFLRLCHTVPTRCELWLKILSCQCHYKRLNGSILNHARCRVHVLRSPNNFLAFQLYNEVRRWYVSYWRNICIYIIPGDWFKYVVLNCTIMDSKNVLNIYGADAEINQQWLGHYHGYRCAGAPCVTALKCIYIPCSTNIQLIKRYFCSHPRCCRRATISRRVYICVFCSPNTRCRSGFSWYICKDTVKSYAINCSTDSLNCYCWDRLPFFVYMHMWCCIFTYMYLCVYPTNLHIKK